MFFLNIGKDQPLFQELVREGVLSSALWESLDLPSEGYVLDILIGHRARLSSQAWVDWLIRKHDCTRIPSLLPDYTFIKALPRELISECLKCDCYPLAADGKHLFIGLGRPDYPEILTRLSEHFEKPIVYRNALTLEEIGEMRALCEQALQSR